MKNSIILITIIVLCSCTSTSKSRLSSSDTNKYLKQIHGKRTVATDQGALELTLDNVFLGHADPRVSEPGDSVFYFPVPAKISYGYHPLEGYELEVSSNCRNNIEVRPLKQPNDHVDNLFSLVCYVRGDKQQAIVLTKNSSSFLDESSDIITGTKFVYTPNVRLIKVNPKKYRLEIVE